MISLSECLYLEKIHEIYKISRTVIATSSRWSRVSDFKFRETKYIFILINCGDDTNINVGFYNKDL